MLTMTSAWSRGTLVLSTVVAILISPAWAKADSGFVTSTDCAGGTCHVTAHTPDRDPAASSASIEGSAASTERGDGPDCVLPDLEFAQSDQEGPLEIPLGMARCVATASGIGVREFDPGALAEQARAVMRLPEPAIGTAPPLGKPRFVNLPSWMWIAEEDWGPVSVTASVSAGAVTVVATPQRVVWDTGDGHEVVCPGPGAVFSQTVYRKEGSPDCGHTYTTLPPGGAGAEVDLTARWEWAVSWSTTDGRGGDLEHLTTTSTVVVPVSEIHSVVTGTR